jgi:hypothetical protein
MEMRALGAVFRTARSPKAPLFVSVNLPDPSAHLLTIVKWVCQDQYWTP